MGLKEKLAAVTAFAAKTDEALAAVRLDWMGRLSEQARIVAEAPLGNAAEMSAAVDAFNARVETIHAVVLATHRPDGLLAEENDAFDRECGKIRDETSSYIWQRGFAAKNKAITRANGAVQAVLLLKDAMESAGSAEIEFGWVDQLVRGCHLAMRAGGEEAFKGEDRALVRDALVFVKENREQLRAYMWSRCSRPADAVRLQEWRDATDAVLATEGAKREAAEALKL